MLFNEVYLIQFFFQLYFSQLLLLNHYLLQNTSLTSFIAL